MALTGNHDLCVTASVKIFADAAHNFVRNPRTQGLADVDMFAGY
jgi:hypothetical protein